MGILHEIVVSICKLSKVYIEGVFCTVCIRLFFLVLDFLGFPDLGLQRFSIFKTLIFSVLYRVFCRGFQGYPISTIRYSAGYSRW